MGKGFLADIPGNKFEFVGFTPSATVASNGASTKEILFRAQADMTIQAAYALPQSGDQGGHGTSYRKVAVFNGGAAGAGTDAIGSYGFTASKAQYGVQALFTGGTVTVAAGDVVCFSQVTVGGNKNTETIVAAGKLIVEYRLE